MRLEVGDVITVEIGGGTFEAVVVVAGEDYCVIDTGAKLLRLTLITLRDEPEGGKGEC